ncbi:Type 1 glutamine amidotransferase-like domain-containing protein [Paraburkholderia megapolitana]|uniref:Peptidase E n=1 Tax=Paraburkholderia megapolitana TaxID=420953 RepID=A0A1I3KWT2_9BURK|nr:Type 1 glutamine amidotransferase-like domain-containing protein [Paraburkholderia megapolitana]QDQ80481.1 DUF3471 domain-containing protein [Paraburkholderia megapolitana]SFI76896.1 Peptidase E [Paraburkholderia megapolitana]
MRRILAIGGFSTSESESLAAAHIRDLTGKAHPKVCLLSTPTGDWPPLVNRFDDIYGKLGCETSNVAFFGGGAGVLCIHPEEAAAHLQQQDAIFVSGGNARCAVALWREWGLDAALKDAWERGVLLSGMSAGAICWFEHHVPPVEHRNLPLRRCLGFLPGSCEVHYHFGGGSRRQEAWETMQVLALPSAIAIDDDAAVLYGGESIAEVFSWREGATAYQLESQPDGVIERALVPKVIGSFSSKPEREPVPLALELKQACVGRYQLMSPIQVLITIEGEQLFAQYGQQPKREIFPQSENQFFWKVVDAQVTFERDRDGKVTSLVHHQNGSDARGEKLE